eukprot:m.38854 g.38854  ORF g.38854 m.38854 type:complete len:201 (-) comp6822_c0_seq2:1650-2252(-)
MSLPYVDEDLNIPGMRDVVNAMLEEEMKNGKPKESKYLKNFPLPKEYEFASAPLVQRAHQEIEEGSFKKGEFDAYRYDVPTPSLEAKNDFQAWKACLQNAYAQYSHQSNRIDNLQLMMDYGGQKWMKHVEQLLELKKVLEDKLDVLRSGIEDINWERQTEQQAAGKELYEMELRWGELIMANRQLEALCHQMEQQQPQKQ